MAHSRMLIIAGDPATAAPLTPAQDAALRSLTIDQWPSVAPIYRDTLAEAQRQAVAGMSDEVWVGVGESLLRFASSQYADCPAARAVIDREVLRDEQVLLNRTGDAA